MITGAIGTFCSLASVTCKESGIATALLLIGYFGFVVIVSEREYRGVIAEKFGPPKDAEE